MDRSFNSWTYWRSTLPVCRAMRYPFVSIVLASQDANGRHLFETATRNLGLHLLSEGRVNEARPVLRAYLNTYEESVRSDMPGGDEGIHLIPRLTLLSYADMLAGGTQCWCLRVGL